MKLRSWINAKRGDKFLRSSMILIGGTAIAQLLAVLSIPVITRLYSPEQFSLLAVYAGFLLLAHSVACLRLEIAIPLPKSEEVAANLLIACLISASLFAITFWIVFRILDNTGFLEFSVLKQQIFQWILPFGIWLSGCFSAFQFWISRQKRFSAIASTKIGQTAIGLMTQIGLGIYGAGAFGLVLGHAILGGAGAFSLAALTKRHDHDHLSGVSRVGVLNAVKKYYRFPIYSAPEALATSAAAQVPLIMIATLSVGPEGGFVLLVMRILGAPLQLIGRSVSQVYLSEAAENWRAGLLKVKTLSIARTMLLCVSLPSLVATIGLAPYFGVIFGPEWAQASVVAIWLAPMYAITAVSNPISTVMSVIGRQRQMLALKIVGLTIRVGATATAAALEANMVAAFALSSVFVYATYLFVFLRASQLDYSESSDPEVDL